jgi:ABC-type antimicrobial peptide transport system permease subunit
VLAGELLIGEEQFLRHLGDLTGFRHFLIRCRPEDESALRSLVTRACGHAGLSIHTTTEVLGALRQVQGTYLAAFGALGGLGLLLGMVGLAVLVVRTVDERRSELGLMLALGFPRGRLLAQFVTEMASLLAAGLGVGLVSALIAVAPAIARGDTGADWLSVLCVLAGTMITGCVVALGAVLHACRVNLLLALRRE